jgi:H+/Cl- antiporter ClcA
MIDSILNGLTVEQFAGYAFYMMLGFLISLLSEQYKFYKPIKRAAGFSIKIWLKENWKRTAMFIIAAFLGIVFMDKYTDGQPSNFSALTLGLAIDVLIDRIFKRKQ